MIVGVHASGAYVSFVKITVLQVGEHHNLGGQYILNGMARILQL